MKIFSGLILPLVLLLGLAGCGDKDRTSEPPVTTTTEVVPEPPRQVATWSESTARHEADWIASQVTPRLLKGKTIERFIDDLPPTFEGSAEALRAIDPRTTALLVAGFHECANAGFAQVTDGTVTYRVRKTANHDCYWAPIRVQVFAVARGLTLDAS